MNKYTGPSLNGSHIWSDDVILRAKHKAYGRGGEPSYNRVPTTHSFPVTQKCVLFTVNFTHLRTIHHVSMWHQLPIQQWHAGFENQISMSQCHEVWVQTAASTCRGPTWLPTTCPIKCTAPGPGRRHQVLLAASREDQRSHTVTRAGQHRDNLATANCNTR